MSRIVPVMKLNEDANAGINLIRAYSSEAITVAGQRLTRPCILAAQTLIADWPVANLASLQVAQLQAVWPLAPQVVLLGTGASQRFPGAEIRAAFASRRIALEPMDLGAACRTYNVLAQEDRAVVALLFPEPEVLA
jgi:uncharacterized protein